MDDEAEALVGKDRESSQRDLFEAIERGDYPRWKSTGADHARERGVNAPYNPFDLTKVWPHADYPLMDVGYFELNRNPDNYFSDVEQVALARPTSFQGLASHQTRCCRVVCSLTAMRIVTV